MGSAERYDVVILGAGLAGNALCRQLLLSGSDKRILLLDQKTDLPGKRQKVGESLVQVGGYYFSKVLDLEEHLFREHFLKYNLRFYWKTRQAANRDFEDYCQSYLRAPSNICSFQLDRNRLETHLLELNGSHPAVTLIHPIKTLKVILSDGALHRVAFTHNGHPVEVEAEWVVDTTGRGQFLKRKEKLQLQSPIRNGAA